MDCVLGFGSKFNFLGFGKTRPKSKQVKCQKQLGNAVLEVIDYQPAY